MHACGPHGCLLLLRGKDIGVDAIHERQEREDKAIHPLAVPVALELDEQASDRLDRTPVHALELRQFLESAVLLHIVEVHGHELQELRMFLEASRQSVGKRPVVERLS